jgi:adenine-specific DNA-methyltransferase
MATSSLLRPFSENLTRQIESKHKEIEKILSKDIGTPTYSDAGFILYRGDCCELLTRLESVNLAVDLTVTSPPYNIGKEYETPMSVEGYVDWCSSWMTQIYKVTNEQGAFWLNVGYLEVAGGGLCVPIPYLIWDKSPFYLVQEVVWKYGAGVTAKRQLSPRNEKWLFYVKDGTKYTFNLDDIRDPNVKYPNQKRNGKYRCNPLGKNPSDVWEFPKVTTGDKRSSKERTAHPAQFPLPVVERIVRASSNPGELVLDPFAGSCSAGLAAAGLGRVFLGIEISDHYCDLAIDRYQRFKRERENAQRQGILLSGY